MKIQFKRIHKDAQIPKKASELAGGWDVVVTEIIKESKDFVICKLGFALTPPKGFKITLVPRSSLTKTNWVLQNSPGLGDEDYTGEYQYRFRAIPNGIKVNNGNGFGKQLFKNISAKLTYSDFPYKVGDRIGQIYLEQVIQVEFKEVNELQVTDRGDGGFGSTGSKVEVTEKPKKPRRTKKKDVKISGE